MAFLIEPNCRCCQSSLKRGNLDHCEACWNRYHNGERDKDYEERGRFKEADKDGD